MEGQISFHVIKWWPYSLLTHQLYLLSFMHSLPETMIPDNMIVYQPTASNTAPAIPVDPPSAVDSSIMHPAHILSVLHRSFQTILPPDWYGYSTRS